MDPISADQDHYESFCTGMNYDTNYLVCNSKEYSIHFLKENAIKCTVSCNIETKEMNYLENNRGNIHTSLSISTNSKEVTHGATVDISEDGERWEGDICNGRPFGYGCYYDSNNCITYKGFMLDTMKVCYGTEFFPGLNCIEYNGGIYMNQRHGPGSLYDKAGKLCSHGYWLMGRTDYKPSIIVSSNYSVDSIHSLVTCLTIDNLNSNQFRAFVISEYPLLTNITIGNNSFQYVNEVFIDSCPRLCCIDFGNDIGLGYAPSSSSNQSNSKTRKTLTISSCPVLDCITFGHNCFDGYDLFRFESNT